VAVVVVVHQPLELQVLVAMAVMVALVQQIQLAVQA
jgi:hypothetical protein